MKMKPVILILTSNDVSNRITKTLKEKIESKGLRYAVVYNKKQYKSKPNPFDVNKYKFVKKIISKSQGSEYSENEVQNDGGRFKRVRNAVVRFKPELVLCLSPYALGQALAAKKTAGFNTPIIGLVSSFTADMDFFDISADALIVANEDAKAEYLKAGLPARAVFPLGLPIEMKKLEDAEKEALKTELGLSGSQTVFLNCYEKRESLEIFDMLLDQGDVINVVAYCPNSETLNELRKTVELKAAENVKLFDKKENVDEYISASDIVVTEYFVPTIFKAMVSGCAVMTFPPKSRMAEKDLKYLCQKNLVYCAEDAKDLINGLYKILQTDLAVKMKNSVAAQNFSNDAGLIADFLTDYNKKDEAAN